MGRRKVLMGILLLLAVVAVVCAVYFMTREPAAVRGVLI